MFRDLASISIEDILTDHAFCEQKATTNCISLIQLYPEKEYLVEKLIPIVNEEWSHFKMVVDELKKRNLKLGAQRQDKYVVALNIFFKKGGSPDDRFLDRLLLAALIDIAEQYFDKEKVKNRWNEWLDYETTVLSELELRGDRVH